MGLQNSSFEIPISFPVDLGGARQASAAMEDLKKSAGAAGKGAAEGGKELEGLGLKGHEAHMALRLIGRSAGEMGHLLHYAFSPELVGIAGFVIALKEIGEAEAKLNEQLLKNIETAREWREVEEQAAASAKKQTLDRIAEYDRMIASALAGENKLKEALESRIKLIDSEATAQKGLLDVEEARVEAAIRLREARGEISPGDADKKIQAAKRQAEDRKEAAEESAAQRKIDEQAKTADQTAWKLRGQEGKPAEMIKAMEPLQEEKNKLDGEIALYEKQLGEAKKKADQATADANEARQIGKLWNSGNLGDKENAFLSEGALFARTRKTPNQLVEDEAQANKSLENNEGLLASAKKNRDAIERELADREKAIKDIEAQNVELTKALEGLVKTIKDGRDALAEKTTEYKQKRAVEAQTDVLNDATARRKRLNDNKGSPDDAATEAAANTPEKQIQSSIGDLSRRVDDATWKARAHMADPGQLHAMLNQTLGLLEDVLLHPNLKGGKDLEARLKQFETRLRNAEMQNQTNR